ncbi:protein of unknown function [Candidatus Nitrosotalea okcheonensis]|uniref:Uncharacterized protein n=1 Tax=Candidatus Nitrosotalea okcheonensis TaxID=1903276 RepID=A0A2H1FE15_9ARCH|nr:protein of unknown function [Candidatus Nitrosotalea okcheonensis]
MDELERKIDQNIIIEILTILDLYVHETLHDHVKRAICKTKIMHLQQVII